MTVHTGPLIVFAYRATEYQNEHASKQIEPLKETGTTWLLFAIETLG